MDTSTQTTQSTDISADPLFLNPRGTLKDRLLDLRIGRYCITTIYEPDNLTTLAFRGKISRWSTFIDNVTTFYNSPPLQHAFNRKAAKLSSINIPEMAKLNSCAMEVRERIEVGAETTMSGRFGENVVEQTAYARDLLMEVCREREGATEEESDGVAALQLPDFVYGGTKHCREYGAYMYFRTLAADGNAERPLAVGMTLGCNEYEMTDDDGSEGIKFKERSVEEAFGPLYRAMKLHNVKYGFLTTYMQTVFVEADIQEKEEDCTLRYSGIIRHSDRVEENGEGMLVGTISVRLGILFLLHKAAAAGAA